MDTFLPTNTFCSCVIEKSAKPLNSIISVAKAAEAKSSVATKDVPPFENADIRISSCLNSVGLNITLIPLDRIHSVVPRDLFWLMDLILPILGSFFTKLAEISSSTGASISADLTCCNISNTCSWVGNCTTSLSGAMILTITFWSVINCLAILLIVLISIIGSSCCKVLYSHSIPGITSSSK